MSPATHSRHGGIAGQARVNVCRGWAHVGMHRKVLPGLQGGRNGLKMAKVVGLEGVVVNSTNRGSRLDHFRNTACVRHRKPLTPVLGKCLLFTAGATNRCTCLINLCVY